MFLLIANRRSRSPPDPSHPLGHGRETYVWSLVAEDSATLIGLVIAAGGLAGHQLTGSSVPDALGSILIGGLLAVVATVLINRNRRFLIGQEADPQVRAAALHALPDAPEVVRVTYLRLEIVGPRMVSVIGDVDLTGDDAESHLAVRLGRSRRRSARRPQWPVRC